VRKKHTHANKASETLAVGERRLSAE